MKLVQTLLQSSTAVDVLIPHPEAIDCVDRSCPALPGDRKAHLPWLALLIDLYGLDHQPQ
jgi:hypothetical protein